MKMQPNNESVLLKVCVGIVNTPEWAYYIKNSNLLYTGVPGEAHL